VIYKIALVKDNNPFTPISLSSSDIQLAPGNYSALLSDQFGNSSAIWDFEVPFWMEPTKISGPLAATTWGVTQSSEIMLTHGSSLTQQGPVVISVDPELVIHENRNREDGIYEITVDFITSGNYSLQFTNGTIISRPYLKKLNLNDSILIDVELNLNGTTMTGSNYTINTSISLGVKTIPVKFRIINQTGDPITNLNITIELTETKEMISTLLNATHFEFSQDLIPQHAIISIYRGASLIYSDETMLSSIIEILLGVRLVEFIVINQNYGSESSSASITLSDSQGNQVVLIAGQSIFLTDGIYSVSILDGRFKGAENFTLFNTNQVTLMLDPLFSTGSLEFADLPSRSQIFLEIVHPYLGNVYQTVFESSHSSIQIPEFPIGLLNITISGTWGMKNQIIFYDPVNTQSKFSFISRTISLVTSDTSNPAKQVELIKIGYTISGDYLDEYLKGSLVIVRIIMLAQLILIVIVLSINFNEIYSSVAIESKSELKILRAMGATIYQTVISYAKFLLYSSVVIALLGQIVGVTAMYLLFRSNQTVYFGHQFRPDLFSIEIFALNLLVVILLTIVAASSTYSKEILKNTQT
jgi:hypothetical protein